MIPQSFRSNTIQFSQFTIALFKLLCVGAPPLDFKAIAGTRENSVTSGYVGILLCF